MLSKTAHDFHQHPWGAFVAGESWLYFAFERGPHGYALWGNPGADDMDRLVLVLERELSREPPHTGLVDLRNLVGVQPATYRALERYTAQHGARLREIVTHTAMVRPSGLIGVMAEGFFRIVRPPFEVSYWTELHEALAHVGHPEPAVGVAELEQARATVCGRSAPLLRLENYLEGALAPSIDGAARACGVSVRTLQRQLAADSTTFGRELIAVRIRRAKALLSDGEEAISSIALDLGFATPQHFSEVFKREVGTTPNAFRARQR